MGVADEQRAEPAEAVRRGVVDLLFAAVLFSVMSVLAKLAGARIPVAGAPHQVAVGAGGVWVTTDAG